MATSLQSAQGQIVILGASGFVGSRLYQHLSARGESLVLVGRSIAKLQRQFPDAAACLSWEGFAASDAAAYGTLINLAGANIGARRWSDSYKRELLESRITTSQICVDLCRNHQHIHYINASGVGAYGFYSGAHAPFTETSPEAPAGKRFLTQLSARWEKQVRQAQNTNPVTLMRMGVVLDTSGGAFPQMMQPFKFYLGAKLGHGRQMLSWISLSDLVKAIVFLIDHPQLTGQVNLSAPGFCNNAHFSEALAKAMGKPCLFRVPSSIMKLMLGELGESLILSGQAVYPERLLNAGFEFQHPKIEDLFRDLFNR